MPATVWSDSCRTTATLISRLRVLLPFYPMPCHATTWHTLELITFIAITFLVVVNLYVHTFVSVAVRDL